MSRLSGVVLDDEDVPPSAVPGRDRDRGRTLRRDHRSPRRERQAHLEGGAAPRAVAPRVHGPAVQRDEAAHEREAEPEPALAPVERGRRLRERLEDPVEQVGRDAHAGVGDAQQRDAVAPRDRDGDRPASGGVLHRVRDEVPDHLLEPHRVPVHQDGVRRIHDVEVDPRALRLRGERLDRPLDRDAEIDDPALERDLAGLDARHLEEIVHQPRELAALARDDRRRPLRLGRRAQEQLGRGVDRGERVSQLVPEHREELIARAYRVRELLEQVPHPVLALPDA